MPNVSSLEEPKNTSLSFLTPPPVTLQILREAKSAGVRSVWLQPGSFDDQTWKYAQENFESAIGGYAKGTVGGEGWCVLVDGERVLDQIARDWKNETAKLKDDAGGKL